MKSIYQNALAFLESEEPFVLATVIRTWGSAPRKAGSHMLITRDNMQGSVSGGCVENDVFRHAQEVLEAKKQRVVHYGVSDEEAWQVGLSCGGSIDVLLECFSPDVPSDVQFWNTVSNAVDKDLGAVVIHMLEDSTRSKQVLVPEFVGADEVGKIAKEAFNNRAHAFAEIEGTPVFIEVVPPRHKLLIIGAAHMAAELVTLARQFDFETIVIDPRGFFTDHFSEKPDHLLSAWPAEVLQELSLTPYTYAVTLSHDPKIDDQALELLLKSDVAYIGALGSKKTHAKRVARLQSLGFTSAEIERIHAPVGIDIRAQSAKEIALSILADLIKEKNKHIS